MSGDCICKKQVYWRGRQTYIRYVFDLGGYIVTIEIVKVFDSLSHSFLLACLKKFGFGHDFIRWVKLLLQIQESCIINSGTTTS